MEFRPAVLGERHHELRMRVRAFIAEHAPPGSYRPGLGMAATPSPEFSRELGANGFLGYRLPEEYGGQAGLATEWFVIVEELLALGLPIGAHWAADRQTATMILLYGTEEHRRRFLPAVVRGECFFCLGMSEPDSGSDLASVRTAATRVEGGWRLRGTKIWTTGAHRSHYIIVLCRTSEPVDGDRHVGLSQMIVPMTAEGVTVNPIVLLDGSHDFNEVVFEDVFVPDDMVLGRLGEGWAQISSELTLERSGPDRFMSVLALLREYFASLDAEAASEAARTFVGSAVARCWAIRQMSVSVADSVDRGENAAVLASMVKDLGTAFEQDCIQELRELTDVGLRPDGDTQLERLLSEATLTGPAFTIRGGTTQVLRLTIARGLRK